MHCLPSSFCVYQELEHLSFKFMQIPFEGYPRSIASRLWRFLISSTVAVILLQSWVTRRVNDYPQMLMMALGCAFYMIGFAMCGFVSGYLLFMTAMVPITLEEMIVMPVGQALAANFAPIKMRGRYMVVSGYIRLHFVSKTRLPVKTPVRGRV